MPWKETTHVQARVRFIEDWLVKEYESLAVLCRVHGVSRKTGYKWVQRFREGGRPALNDRPRRWRSHPHTTAPDVVAGARNPDELTPEKEAELYLRRRRAGATKRS